MRQYVAKEQEQLKLQKEPTQKTKYVISFTHH